jgi:hypothetical protein
MQFFGEEREANSTIPVACGWGVPMNIIGPREFAADD